MRETAHRGRVTVFPTLNCIYCKEKSRKISGRHFSSSALLTFIHSFILVYFYCMCMGVLLCMYVCITMHAWYLWRLEEGVGPLEMDLQMVVSHNVGENRAWVLYKDKKCS